MLVCHVLPPLDRSLYQAEKALKNSEHAVRDGGAMVLVAACPDGVGPRRFVDLLAAAPDEASARAHIEERGYRLGDHKAVRWRSLQARGVRIGLVAPAFPEADAQAAGLRVFREAAQARAWAREQFGNAARVVNVPDAAHTVVHVRAS